MPAITPSPSTNSLMSPPSTSRPAKILWHIRVGRLAKNLRGRNHPHPCAQSQAIPMVAGFDWPMTSSPSGQSHPCRGHRLHRPPLRQQAPARPVAHWLGGGLRLCLRQVPRDGHRIRGFAAPQTAAATPPAIPPATTTARASRGGGPSPAYGPTLINYLEGHGISWTVWCFDLIGAPR